MALLPTQRELEEAKRRLAEKKRDGQINETEESGMEVEQFKEEFPDQCKVIYDEGFSSGYHAAMLKKSDPPESDGSEATKTTETPEPTTLEEKVKADWDKDESIRAEFKGDYDAYLAYLKANADGLVRIVGRKGETDEGK